MKQGRKGSAEKCFLRCGNKFMSRLAKQPIEIPAGVEVLVSNSSVSVKGPKGEIKKSLNSSVPVSVEDGKVKVTISPSKDNTALSGTIASHIMNMIEGVTKGFSKKIILEGIGYKADVKGKEIVCALGFSHPVNILIPEGLSVVSEKGTLTVSGIDKDLVGSFSAKIRDYKKPEPYKGKGFRYENEVIQRKQGKKSV